MSRTRDRVEKVGEKTLFLTDGPRWRDSVGMFLRAKTYYKPYRGRGGEVSGGGGAAAELM